jgi:hypothetical protein
MDVDDFDRLEHSVEWDSGLTLEEMMFEQNEADTWCQLNCEDSFILGPSSALFASEVDAMAFKLKWA